MLLDLNFNVSTDELMAVELSLDIQRRLEQFLFHEANLLDERRLQDWLDLWTDDGMYWIPQMHDQASPYDHISLMWEDKMMREVRVRRAGNARNWSQQNVTRSTRLLGNVRAAGVDAEGNLVAHAAFQMTEWHKSQARQRAGRITYKLAPQGDSWQIRLKRVDLVNCDAVHGIIEVFI